VEDVREPGQGFPNEACWAQICADAQNSGAAHEYTNVLQGVKLTRLRKERVT